VGGSTAELRRYLAGSCLVGLTVFAAVLLGRAPLAAAVITPPTTIDGPSVDALSLGAVAMAPDGTGGLVYTKTFAGVPHIFASRYAGGQWSPPIRVDWDQPYEAGQATIAAGPNGRLMVVWVTQVATLVSGEVRRGLYSASLGPGAIEFGPSLLVDPNVGSGSGVDPSLAGTAPGKAIVAYRVVTKTFGLPGEFTNAAQLRPGDVLADIRVARLETDRWSRLGAINRYPAASMRPPSETNGPKVAIGAGGRAVVAWQEPDQTGAARAWMRRVTGTTLGPVLAASPESFEGKPVSDDATAIGVAVSGFDRARVAVRVDGGPSSTLGGPRIFLTTLAANSSPSGGKPVGPAPVDGGPASGPLGPPSVAASDGSGAEGSLLLAYSAASGLRVVRVDGQGQLLGPEAPAGPAAAPDGPTATAVDAEGGGTLAYTALDAEGAPAVAVRQEYPGGGSQTGLLYGPLGGPVSQLVGDGPESGDALIAFRQGESGSFAIVADRVASPPAQFPVTVPKGWVQPRRAQLRWEPAPSAVGGVTYGLVVDGRLVRSGLTARSMTPKAAVLGSGVREVQVMATDRLGGDVISKPAKLRVDGEPPRLRVKLQRRRGRVALQLKDAESGLKAKVTRVSFGDGERAHGGSKFKHRFPAPGRYTVRVSAADRVGNVLAERVRVVVR
jgi:PKD domain-containing protein